MKRTIILILLLMTIFVSCTSSVSISSKEHSERFKETVDSQINESEILNNIYVKFHSDMKRIKKMSFKNLLSDEEITSISNFYYDQDGKLSSTSNTLLLPDNESLQYYNFYYYKENRLLGWSKINEKLLSLNVGYINSESSRIMVYNREVDQNNNYDQELSYSEEKFNEISLGMLSSGPDEGFILGQQGEYISCDKLMIFSLNTFIPFDQFSFFSLDNFSQIDGETTEITFSRDGKTYKSIQKWNDNRIIESNSYIENEVLSQMDFEWDDQRNTTIVTFQKPNDEVIGVLTISWENGSSNNLFLWI